MNDLYLRMYRDNTIFGSFLKFHVTSFYGEFGGLQFIGIKSRPIVGYRRKLSIP